MTSRDVEFIQIGAGLYSAKKIIYIWPLAGGGVKIKLEDGVSVHEGAVAYSDIVESLRSARSPQA